MMVGVWGGGEQIMSDSLVFKLLTINKYVKKEAIGYWHKPCGYVQSLHSKLIGAQQPQVYRGGPADNSALPDAGSHSHPSHDGGSVHFQRLPPKHPGGFPILFHKQRGIHSLSVGN